MVISNFKILFIDLLIFVFHASAILIGYMIFLTAVRLLLIYIKDSELPENQWLTLPRILLPLIFAFLLFSYYSSINSISCPQEVLSCTALSMTCLLSHVLQTVIT